MTLRFRRSIKLAPGIRMNLSGGGISWTLGPRGASIGIGQRGTFLNTGFPGTGLSSRQRLDGVTSRNHSASNHRSSKSITMDVTVSVQDDGAIIFKDANGNLLPENLVERAKKQNSDAIKQLIQNSCDKINSQIESLAEIHYFTPDSRVAPVFKPHIFDEPSPYMPQTKGHGLLGFFFTSIANRIDSENRHAKDKYEQQVKDWNKLKAEHSSAEIVRKQFVETDIYKNVSSMETYLEEVLQDIVWPRETIVSFDIVDNGRRIMLDVDLPEQEDMPRKIASVPQRGYRLSVKEMSPTQIQKLYMRHVHAVGFRIAGEAFAALPVIEQLVLSAYSQRPNRKTGQIGNEYLFSVRICRTDWEKIRFDKLNSIDVVESLEQFELRREMTKTGVFKDIEPFGD